MFLRNCDLRGGVVLKAKGMTLKHLEAIPLAGVTINIHGHDCQRKLSGVLHLKTLPDCKERLSGAQACGRKKTPLICPFIAESKPNVEEFPAMRRADCFSHRHDTPSEWTEER